MSTPGTLERSVRSCPGPTGRCAAAPAGLHDDSEVRVTSDRPAAFQVDGEYMGEHESVLFESIPEAIRVIF